MRQADTANPAAGPASPAWIARARAALTDGGTAPPPGLPRLHVGHCIAFYQSVPSTMPIARQRLDTRGPAAAGAVIIADEQTAGRGRLQRSWNAPAGRGLLGSYILCADLLPDRPSLPVMIAGLALLAAVRQRCPQLEDRLHLKWPNDLVVLDPGGPLKLAGILVESIFHQGKQHAAILGIGINVNQRQHELPRPRPGGLPPSSLTIAGRQPDVARAELLVALCRALDHLCAPCSRPPADILHARWQRALLGLGAPVSTYHAGAPLRGRAVATTPQGALLVRTATGETLEIHSGDVTFDWNAA